MGLNRDAATALEENVVAEEDLDSEDRKEHRKSGGMTIDDVSDLDLRLWYDVDFWLGCKQIPGTSGMHHDIFKEIFPGHRSCHGIAFPNSPMTAGCGFRETREKTLLSNLNVVCILVNILPTSGARHL